MYFTLNLTQILFGLFYIKLNHIFKWQKKIINKIKYNFTDAFLFNTFFPLPVFFFSFYEYTIKFYGISITTWI